MASLRYPPNAFVQSVKQRHRGLGKDQILLVVEGANDKRMLAPLLSHNVHILPARGRPMVLEAFQALDHSVFRRCVFVVDCDNDVPPNAKGHRNLVITTFRDLDADALLALKSYDRVFYEYYYELDMTPEELEAESEELFDFATTLACLFGQLKDAARTLGVRVRIDTDRGGKIAVQPSSLPSIGRWVSTRRIPALEEICAEMAGLLGWTRQQREDTLDRAADSWKSACSRHGDLGCDECHVLALCGGHDLTSLIAVDLSIRRGIQVSREQLESLSRMTTDSWRARRWSIGERLERWANEQGLKVLRAL